MNATAVPATNRRGRPGPRPLIAAVAVLVLLAAMALNTTVVIVGAPGDVQPGVFSAAQFGKDNFPKVQSAIAARAVDAATLAAAIAQDRAAVEKKYGVPSGVGPEISVAFTGVASSQDSGIYSVAVAGVPATTTIHVQTGPAINGTDLRDATGTIGFGQFSNQIEYQNAASALNKEMKKQVLAKVDAGKLSGKTIAVVGAFQLVDANNWLVTPVKLDVR